MVPLHEAMHDQILNETVFGFLQRTFYLYRQPLVSSRWREYGEHWLSVLAHDSRRAHEQAATYLTIKKFRAKDRIALVRGLNSEYRGYYDDMALCVDRQVRSSYLQHSLASVLVYLAFRSPLLHRIVRGAAEPSVLPSESPNARLEYLQTRLFAEEPFTVSVRVREQMAEHASKWGLEASFDIESDRDWASLPLDVSRPAETNLNKLIEKLVLKSWCDLPMPRRAEIVSDGIALLRRTGKRRIVVGVLGPGLTDMFWPGERDARRIQEGLAYARSVLFNEPKAVTGGRHRTNVCGNALGPSKKAQRHSVGGRVRTGGRRSATPQRLADNCAPKVHLVRTCFGRPIAYVPKDPTVRAGAERRGVGQ